MLEAVAQDIKDRLAWTIGTMEQQAEQALRQVAEQKKSGWGVMEDLATMYGQQVALRYRKQLVRELELGLPVADAVNALTERVEDDLHMWHGARSTNPSGNLIDEQQHVALLALYKELRNAQKHIGRTVSIENAAGLDGVFKQQ
jgi:hypothetical protein